MREAPKPCSNAALAAVAADDRFADLLKQVSVSVALMSTSGRTVVTYVQDVLVPGLNTDAKIGRAPWKSMRIFWLSRSMPIGRAIARSCWSTGSSRNERVVRISDAKSGAE
jgi:hypothetical protein